MKFQNLIQLKIFTYLALFWISADLQAKAAREIEFRVEKIGEVTHWMPESVSVVPGETLKITARYDLKGGFDFHGFAIPKLKVAKKVERNKPEVFEVTIPEGSTTDLDVTCQFHAPHRGAKLILKTNP